VSESAALISPSSGIIEDLCDSIALRRDAGERKLIPARRMWLARGAHRNARNACAENLSVSNRSPAGSGASRVW